MNDLITEKQGVDEILSETLPENSKELYEKRWVNFMEFIGEPVRRPTESDYLRYFDYLHEQKKQQASSLWSLYSSLNSIHQRKYAEKLQTFPELTQLLRTYNNTYVRKVALVLESSQIEEFFHMDLSTPYWIVRKAVVALAICGGLRCAEIRKIDVSDVERKDHENYEISIMRKKQQGEKTKSKFLVPPPFSIHLTTYLAAVRAVLGNNVGGAFIKGAPKSSFVNQAMGKNMLSNIGKNVAEILKVENPERYTGHCFRRTAATIAADGGATTEQLQRAFGWKTARTAQMYVDRRSSAGCSMATITRNTQQKNKAISPSSTNRDGELVSVQKTRAISPSGLCSDGELVSIQKNRTISTSSTSSDGELVYGENRKIYRIQATGDTNVFTIVE